MAINERIYPENIRLDGGTQPRAKIDQAVCDEYGERMKAGEKFPPVDVFFDGEDYWLADGFHRLQAYVMALPGEAIECNLYQGSLADAQWHSYSVNKTHGLRRTNEDKLRATRAALAHANSKGVSDAALADYVGVHRQTVQKLRHELTPSKADLSIIDKSIPRKGCDGRTINTSKIGKNPKSKTKRKKGIRISPDAAPPVLGHSLPNPVISLNLPPTNPVIAAATIFKLFDVNFVRTLIAELTQRLKGIEQ
jgi:hypothetical protein